jgi:hypothetical protein
MKRIEMKKESWTATGWGTKTGTRSTEISSRAAGRLRGRRGWGGGEGRRAAERANGLALLRAIKSKKKRA